MRAATRSGFVFVGGRIGRARPEGVTKETFRPKTIRSNPQAQKQKEDRHKSLQMLANSLQELITTAVTPKEAEFWQQQLTRLKGSNI
jgi:hypothetical protein